MYHQLFILFAENIHPGAGAIGHRALKQYHQLYHAKRGIQISYPRNERGKCSEGEGVQFPATAGIVIAAIANTTNYGGIPMEQEKHNKNRAKASNRGAIADTIENTKAGGAAT